MSEQPEPKPGRRAVPPIALDAFTRALAQQDRKGRARYGAPLQTFNGRDAGRDAFEELVDLAQYLTQLRLEHAELGAERARWISCRRAVADLIGLAKATLSEQERNAEASGEVVPNDGYIWVRLPVGTIREAWLRWIGQPEEGEP